MRKLLFLLLVLSNALNTSAQDTEQLISEGKKLRAQYKDQEAINKFEEVLKKDANNLVALQNVSYLLSIEGERKKTREEKAAYFDKAKKYAEKSLQLNENDAENHYNLALALGRMSLIASSEEKLKYAKQIRTEAETAIRLNPKHAPSYHILGRLNREIANMSSIKVMAAKALYGGVPENCSFQKAEEYFNKAIGINPKYILYYYDAALNYEYMGKKQEAKKLLEKAVTLPMQSPDDPYRLQDCKNLLARLK